MDDWELIEELVRKGWGGGLAALVGRYLGMVYGVAMREVGGGHHLAEDVTQAVFALLAKKAPEMVAGTVVAGWLFRTGAVYGRRMRRRWSGGGGFHEERAGRACGRRGWRLGREERMRLLDGAGRGWGSGIRGAVIYAVLPAAGDGGGGEGSAWGFPEGAATAAGGGGRWGGWRAKMGVKMGVGVGETRAGMLGGLGVVAVKMPAGCSGGGVGEKAPKWECGL